MLIGRAARSWAFLPLIVTLALVSPALAQSNPQAAPCKAYFTAFQSGDPNAQPLVSLNKSQSSLPVFQSSDVNARVVVGLNKPQSSWYQQNNGKEKFAGICLWDPDNERVSAEEFVHRIDKLDAPLYVMAWIETTRTEGDRIEYLQGRQTPDNLPAPPTLRTSSRTLRYTQADGLLARWDEVSHTLVGLKSLQRSIVFGAIAGPDIPASVLLLEDGLEAIRKSLDPGQ
jgi:hypothetical protein